MFPFLEFCRNTQKSLSEFSKAYSNLPDDPTNHFSLRLFFIMDFLQRFLPSNIDIAAGEIVDFTGRKSSKQDIVLYRSNYPVFRSSDYQNTYLLESVIATIEILPRNKSIELRQAFINCASVKNLKPTKHNILANNSQDYMELKLRTVPKTFIFSFCNSVDQDEFVKLYQKANKGTSEVVPDGVFILSNPAIYAQYDTFTRKTTFMTKDPFIQFFQQLFSIFMADVSPFMRLPDISAAIRYDFSKYFSDLDKQLIENK
jgi:hypothetical protein